MAQTQRKKPNILITGTPGTGKTTTSSAVAEATELRHINFGDLVKDKNLHDGWDHNLHCYLINEDLVKESHPKDIVVALRSDSIDDMNRNVATLTDWIMSWSPTS